jgi:hypothetical protein
VPFKFNLRHYGVEEYVRVKSEDGPYIYKFKLVAIPGKSKAPAPPTVGAVQAESSLTHTLKPPGVNP